MISLNSISQEYLHNLQICKSFWWRIYDVWTDWKRNKSEIFRLSPRLPILMNTWYLLAAIQDVWRRHYVFFLALLLQIWYFQKVSFTSLFDFCQTSFITSSYLAFLLINFLIKIISTESSNKIWSHAILN